MNKKKILVVTGSRAEYGLLKSVIDEIIKSEKLELRLLVTGMHTLQKYGLTVGEIEKDGVLVADIVSVGEDDDMLTSLAKEIIGIKEYCERDRPDLILILGDRDEPFAAAVVGGHLGIPIAHLHGGDFTARVVDGALRDAITKFAHLHFTACESSYKRVINLQEDERSVYLVGAPGLDHARNSCLLSKEEIAQKLNLDAGKPWLLFVMHPAPFEKISFEKQISGPLLALEELKNYEKIIIYPNSDTGTEIFIGRIDEYKNNGDCHIFKNLSRIYYLSLLKCIDFLIGNSSSGVIETAFFKLPAINIGGRQNNRERGGNVVDCDYGAEEIKKTIQYLRSDDFKKKLLNVQNPYGDGTAGKKIVKILEEARFEELFLKNKTYA